MKKWEIIVVDDADRNEAIRQILTWKLEKPVKLTVQLYKKNRSAAQNALAAVWYRDRGKQTGHGEAYERCYCKLIYGVPIMMKHDYFAEAWLPYQKQPYERQFDAMKIVDVTSLMSTEEMTEYMYSVENDSYENGLALTKPKMYNEAMRP